MLLLLALTNSDISTSITALLAIALAEIVRELRSWQRGRRLEDVERILMEEGRKRKSRSTSRIKSTGKKQP